MSGVLALFAALMVPATADAQWLKLTTPGVPRTADGKPNLRAPAPRQSGKPDLTGLWRFSAVGYTNNVTTDLKPEEIDPSAVALYNQRQEDLFTDDPSTFRCLPSGPRQIYAPIDLVRIVQTPTMVVMLYEDLVYRQIFIDGRTLPKDPNPSFMGYSIGRWEGDTLVVDSIGFNDTTWLDYGGHPHSEALRITERISRTDPSNTMKIHVTLNGNALFMDVGGKDKAALIPQSESTFTNNGVRLEFTPDRVIFHLLERDTQAMKEQ